MPNNNQMTKLSYNDVQRLINETEQLKSQLQFYIQQSTLVNDSITDLEGSRLALKEILSRKEGEKLLIPLGTQLLLPVIIDSKTTVLHDLGSNISKNIPVEDSIKKIESRIELFRKSATSLNQEIYKLETIITQRENFLNQLVPADTKK